MKPDVFICYSSQDESFANKLFETLERDSVKCWFAPKSILPGQKWGGEIMRALENCKTLLFILSKDSNDSDQVLTELETAKDRRIPIIPVKIEDVDLSYDIKYFIRSHQWIDAKNATFEVTYSNVIKSLKGHLNIRGNVDSVAGKDEGHQPPEKEKKAVRQNNNTANNKNDATDNKSGDKTFYLKQNLGIETSGGVLTVLVEAGTKLPHTNKQTFSTAVDNQPSIEVHILSGNRNLASDCRSLGTFQLKGIHPAKKGIPQIEIELHIREDGMVSATGKDLETKNAHLKKMGMVDVTESVQKQESLQKPTVVECPKCKAKARLKDGIPLDKTVIVKCPKCSHKFKVQNSSFFGLIYSELLS